VGEGLTVGFSPSFFFGIDRCDFILLIILARGMNYNDMQRCAMGAALENLTTAEAAIAAGVTVSDVNRVIDRKILPGRLFSATEIRTLRKDACLFIAFYYETAEWLTSAARMKAIRDSLAHGHSWIELKECKIEETRAVWISWAHIWEDVERRFKQLEKARKMVVEDPEILQGTPVIRGTRIPIYDVASLVDAETPIQELSELYPRLDPEQFALASIYAKANPQRGRPKRRPLLRGRVGLPPRLRQTVKTLFAVGCKSLDRQDHCSAF
jgi:uncharacterized protein (DUF433 family)